MARYHFRRLLPIILLVGIIIVSIVILVSVIRAVISSGNAPQETKQQDTTQEALLNTSAGRAVELTVRGPIVADEDFRSYHISISPSARTIQTYKGYLETKIEEKTLPNNVAAYEEFVHALNKANMTKGTQFDGDKNDIRGICAIGRVSQFSLINDGDTAEMLWTSTCKGSPGSLNASADQLTSLFVKQIPDAQDIIRKLSF